MDTNEIINKLESIKKLIVDQKYGEAIEYIDKTKLKILVEEDTVNNYMDSLVKDLR